ncbi:MAG: DNA polymerase [Roseibacillus sp.]
MLSPFSSDTGRNQPPSSKFIFGASSWLRSIVSCPEGKVLAYVDYTSQEVGLAAALSKDRALLSDYESGDPYIAFAIRAGAAPSGSTKKTHPNERASYKTAALAIQYGIGEVSLAGNLGIPLPAAKRLVREHQSAYPKYWQWRQTVVDEVNCGGTISTQFGWQRKAKQKDSANSVANFPVQAAGAEILRIAIIALEESGHSVVAPVHDAVLVEMEYEGWTEELAEVRRLMSKAAKAVTGGLSIPTDVELTFPGENFLDSRGQSFWEIVKPVIGRGPLMNPKFDAFRASESQM